MRGQLLQNKQGDLLCSFPSRLILVANHQVRHGCDAGKTKLNSYRSTQTGSTYGGLGTPLESTAIFI